MARPAAHVLPKRTARPSRGTEARGPETRRRLLDPARALDAVLDEFVRPRCRAIEDALAPFLPGASERVLALHAISVLGQIVYHRCAPPVALGLLGEKEYTPALVDEIVEHVLRF